MVECDCCGKLRDKKAVKIINGRVICELCIAEHGEPYFIVRYKGDE